MVSYKVFFLYSSKDRDMYVFQIYWEQQKDIIAFCREKDLLYVNSKYKFR